MILSPALKETIESFLETYESLKAFLLYWFPSTKEPSPYSDIFILPGFRTGMGFYEELAKELTEHGYRTSISQCILPKFSKEEALQILQKELLELKSPITILAHNISGLLVGELADSSRRKIKNLVTLGTPFGGTNLYKDWNSGTINLQNVLRTILLIPEFTPLSSKDSVWKGQSTLYGQARDLWFDIFGNNNLVKRKENIQSLVEYLLEKDPPKQKTESKKEMEAVASKEKIRIDSPPYHPKGMTSKKDSKQEKLSRSDKPVKKVSQTSKASKKSNSRNLKSKTFKRKKS